MRTLASFASKRLAVVVIAFVTIAHGAIWHVTEKTLKAPDVRNQLASVSYSPYASSDPKAKDPVKPEQIRAELKAISAYTSAIRLYSSTAGNELVPPIAAEFGLKVTLGVWIDGRLVTTKSIETKPSGLVYFSPLSEEELQIPVPAGDHTLRLGFIDDPYIKTLAKEDIYKNNVNKWIGTAAAPGLLNGAPFNLPAGLNIRRVVPTTATATAP